jgi:hypothetical protein
MLAGLLVKSIDEALNEVLVGADSGGILGIEAREDGQKRLGASLFINAVIPGTLSSVMSTRGRSTQVGDR